MESSRSPKRRRPITACSECQRRKQKCDRKHPCGTCETRGIPARCSYVNVTCRPSPAEPIRSENSGLIDTAIQEASTQNEPNEGLEGGASLGYSIEGGSNAFTGLRSSLSTDNRDNSHFPLVREPKGTKYRDRNSPGLTSSFPDDRALQELVDVFFSQYDWQYPIIEPFYFRQLFSKWLKDETSPIKHLSETQITKELGHFPALLFQVLALAVQVLPPDSPILNSFSSDQLRASKAYSDIGISLLPQSNEHCSSLNAVLTYFLRCSYMKNAGRGTEAWHSLGTAIRQGQELGLHLDKEVVQTTADSLNDTLSQFWYNEYKRRIWANLFIFDSLMAIILGRPRMINSDDCDTSPPMDCNIPENPSTSIPLTIQQGSDHNAPRSVSVTLFRLRLARIVHEMLATRSEIVKIKNYSRVGKFHNEICEALYSLPPTLLPEDPDNSYDTKFYYLVQLREDLLTLSNLVLLSLHRPYINTRPESLREALQAAIITLKSQERTFRRAPKHFQGLFSLAFYTVDATIFLCTILGMKLPIGTSNIPQIKQLIRESIDRLDLMQNVNATARAGLKILRLCWQKLRPFFEGAPLIRLEGPEDSTLQSSSLRTEIMANLRDSVSSAEPNSSLSTFDAFNAQIPDLEDEFGGQIRNDFSIPFWLDRMEEPFASAFNPFEYNLAWESVDFT